MATTMESNHDKNMTPGSATAGSSATDSAETDGQEVTNPRLAVVDDNAQVRRLVCRWLKRRGCEVLEYTGGREALVGLESEAEHVDAVLLDVMMPEMSGVEVLRELRKRWSGSDLPVVMLTARSESSLVVEALEAGANDYVTKPIDLPVLMARLTSHITRRRATAGLKERERRLELAVSASGEGIWDWDITRQTLHVSGPWRALLGYPAEATEVTPAWWLEQIHEADAAALKTAVQAHLSGEAEHLSVEHRVRCADGSYRWVRTRGQASRDDAGRAIRLAGAMSDVSAQPLHDPTTGLPGRRYFEGRLAQADEAGAHFAVICLSSDLVGTVSDTMGEEVGRSVQKTLAERLTNSARAYDDTSQKDEGEGCVIACLGMGEFVVLCHPRERRDEATELAAVFRHELTKPIAASGTQLRPSVYSGLAYGPASAGDPEQVLADARVALKRGRKTGAAETFNGSMREEMVGRLRLEGDLQRAIKNDEFRLQYQPIVDSTTGEVVTLEALIRWMHPERGFVRPDLFIPAAEEGRQIVPIGAWVLRKACTDLAEWIRGGGEPVRVAINVSPVQIWHGGFVDTLARVLRETRVDPALIELELTEQLFVGREHAVLELLHEIRTLGVSLAIDDFGTGYSSLAYLRRFPVDKLKIDKTFVDGVPHEQADLAIVQAVVSLSHALGKSVVAEGVETRNQATALRDLGVNYLQGWHYGKPADFAASAVVGRQAAPVAVGQR